MFLKKTLVLLQSGVVGRILFECNSSMFQCHATLMETPNGRFFHFYDGALRFLPEKTLKGFIPGRGHKMHLPMVLFWLQSCQYFNSEMNRVPSIKVFLIDFRHVWHVSSCIYYLYYHKMLQTTISRNHPRTYSYPWWKKSYTTWDLYKPVNNGING